MTTNLIIHIGTGTIINADECVLLRATDEQASELEEHELIDLAQANGKPINTTDLKWGNVIAYSPMALRDEALATIDEGYADGDDGLRETLSYVVNIATDDELEEIASYILNADDVWDSYRSNLIEGAKWAFEQHKFGRD